MTNNEFPDRKHNRLPEYDYSLAGLYFVTICIHQHQHVLGRIENNQVLLTHTGEICREEWFALLVRFQGIHLDEFAIMPNHIHCIMYLSSGKDSFSLSEIIGTYKSLVARKYYDWCNSSNLIPVSKLWQRSFHDHIIRNERALDAIREYIRLNPANWDQDSENISWK